MTTDTNLINKNNFISDSSSTLYYKNLNHNFKEILYLKKNMVEFVHSSSMF